MNVRESESEKKRRREEGDTGNLKNATCEEFRQMSDGKIINEEIFRYLKNSYLAKQDWYKASFSNETLKLHKCIK